jgi:hypothetical protein
MSPTLAREPVSLSWIVCFGTGLAVDQGRVSCPVRTEAVEVAMCLDCRFLSAVADERAGDRDCRMPDRMRGARVGT